jgi:hypothetical protein
MLVLAEQKLRNVLIGYQKMPLTQPFYLQRVFLENFSKLIRFESGK